MTNMNIPGSNRMDQQLNFAGNLKNDKSVIGKLDPSDYYSNRPIDVSTEEFKRGNALTLKNFAKDVASYNFWSFPEDAKKEAQELLTAFDSYSTIWTDFTLEKAKLKTGKTTPAKVAKKRKDFQTLGQLQITLFNNISKKIITWYDNIYKGHKSIKYEGDIYYGSTAIKNANKFYFVAQKDFSCLLYE